MTFAPPLLSQNVPCIWEIAMNVARFDPWRCFRCNFQMDSAAEVLGDALPSEGDLALCLNCAEPHVLHFGKWVRLTDDELIDMDWDDKQKMSKVQMAIREFRKKEKENDD